MHIYYFNIAFNKFKNKLSYSSFIILEKLLTKNIVDKKTI